MSQVQLWGFVHVKDRCSSNVLEAKKAVLVPVRVFSLEKAKVEAFMVPFRVLKEI